MLWTKPKQKKMFFKKYEIKIFILQTLVFDSQFRGKSSEDVKASVPKPVGAETTFPVVKSSSSL